MDLETSQAGASLAAAITAGGQSRRFGQDKALYKLAGTSLLERVALSLEECAPRFLIAPEGRYVLPGWLVQPDLRPGEGPLAGLETALTLLRRAERGQETASGWLAYSAVDLPNLTPVFWTVLAAHARPSVQAVIGHDAFGRPQPLAALYHLSALSTVSRLLGEGERRMLALLDALRVAALPWSVLAECSPEVYENLNRPPGVPGNPVEV